MTITRALTELKHIRDKLETRYEQPDLVLVGLYQERKNQILHTSLTKEEFETKTKSLIDSTLDLLARRDKIKSAIIKSNASTYVTIGDQKLTVAEAIALKQTLPLHKEFLDELKRQYNHALTTADQSRRELEEKIEKMLENNLGGNKKTSSEDYNNIAKPFIEANEIKIYDPANIKALIERLEEQISEFESEVDFVLSESNAKTEIEI